MKKLSFFFIAFFLIPNLFLSYCFAQDYTQWNLPEGAKMRLGKGEINDVIDPALKGEGFRKFMRKLSWYQQGVACGSKSDTLSSKGCYPNLE